MSPQALTTTDMPKLKLLAKGKVRDIYALPDAQDEDKLLFVATDRISAFDVIMENVSRAAMDLNLSPGAALSSRPF
jgi:phosphoribosylaminoimidazole-succinocarboxamide synthase